MFIQHKRAAVAALFLTVVAAWSCSDDSTSPPPPTGDYAIIEAFIGNGEQGAAIDGVSPLQTPLYWPQDVSIDSQGRAYVIDWNNYRLRIVEDGIIRTLVGSGNPVPDGESEAPSGPAREVDLNHMTHISFDNLGNIILSGFHSSAVFKYDFATDRVSPICGNGVRSYGGDGGLATAAIVNLPVCAHYDSEGTLYIMDQANQRLRIVEADTIRTFVGTGVAGFSGDGGIPQTAQINLPVGQNAWPAGKFTITADGTIYIADTNNHRIRKVEPASPVPGLSTPAHENYTITTVAGNGTGGFSGDGGAATSAQLRLPGSVAVDSQGNVYISDTYNHCIRKVDTNGVITTFAGHPGVPFDTSGIPGNGGAPLNAFIYQPAGIFVDSADNIYIADVRNNQIRVIRK